MSLVTYCFVGGILNESVIVIFVCVFSQKQFVRSSDTLQDASNQTKITMKDSFSIQPTKQYVTSDTTIVHASKPIDPD